MAGSFHTGVVWVLIIEDPMIRVMPPTSYTFPKAFRTRKAAMEHGQKLSDSGRKPVVLYRCDLDSGTTTDFMAWA